MVSAGRRCTGGETVTGRHDLVHLLPLAEQPLGLTQIGDDLLGAVALPGHDLAPSSVQRPYIQGGPVSRVRVRIGHDPSIPTLPTPTTEIRTSTWSGAIVSMRLLGVDEGGVHMTRTGFCTMCGTDVQLTESGSCPAGHGSDCITETREVHDPPATPTPPIAPESAVAATAPAKKSNKRILVIAAIVVAALALVFGGMAVFGVFTSTGSQVHKALRAHTLSNGQTLDSLVKSITVDGNAVTIALNQTPVQLEALGGGANDTESLMNVVHAIETAVTDGVPKVKGVRVLDTGNNILETVVRP